MDVIRGKNAVKMYGNVEITEQLTAKNLVIDGEVVINGKPLGDITNTPTNELYIGNPENDGCWKVSLENNELLFSHKVDGAWVIKQAMA